MGQQYLKRIRRTGDTFTRVRCPHSLNSTGRALYTFSLKYARQPGNCAIVGGTGLQRATARPKTLNIRRKLQGGQS
jgi:hypothetical protein